MILSDWIGSIGVFLILLAYILNLSNVLTNKHVTFIMLNLVGAAMAGIASYLINYVPFIILEGAWVLVSVWGLINLKSQKLNEARN